ncbi:MAG: hypothetical protein R6X19_06665 [Kiritimatiellia bacterium]
MGGEILIGFVFLLACIAIFLVCREIFCWYWKVNKMVALLERIATKLESQPLIRQPIAPPSHATPKELIKCPACHKHFTQADFKMNDEGAGTCPSCGQHIAFE